MVIAIAWNIWLARNRKVFDNVVIPARRLEENCIETIKLWANRCRNQVRWEAITEWAAANA
jgi:hypothetical protein